jgi:tetratricopeptide (TPR) repeat protein
MDTTLANDATIINLRGLRTFVSVAARAVGAFSGLIAVMLAVAMCDVPIWAQHVEGSLPHDFDEPIRLYTTLGSYSRPISSTHADAEEYFNQGFRLMYAYAHAEAGRSFREAERRDPDCAICFWGEAWAWSPFLSEGRTAEHDARAYAAIQKARAIQDRASPVEKALIDAMGARFAERFEPSGNSDLDRAYARAMARVADTYPEDADVATLYAESLFLMLPRAGPLDIRNPEVASVVAVLEGALKRDIKHPGACHLYVHTTELTTEPQRALACVEFLGNAVPGASHLNHMPAHTWTRVGRWGDAVAASLHAWQTDQKGVKGDAIVTYPAHDLQMLVYAASYDGQSAPAISAARGIAKLTGDPMYLALALVRFGRFNEITTMGERPAASIPGGMWDFARGYAALRAGDRTSADKCLTRLARAAQSSETFKFHPAMTLLGTIAAILEGEIARSAGDMPTAIAALERAVSLNDAIVIDDPEPLPFAARHWLGAALLDAKRFADAERVYRDDLARHPHNGWALTGLELALKGQRKPATAIEQERRASWARSDTPLQTSRF